MASQPEKIEKIGPKNSHNWARRQCGMAREGGKQLIIWQSFLTAVGNHGDILKVVTIPDPKKKGSTKRTKNLTYVVGPTRVGSTLKCHAIRAFIGISGSNSVKQTGKK